MCNHLSLQQTLFLHYLMIKSSKIQQHNIKTSPWHWSEMMIKRTLRRSVLEWIFSKVIECNSTIVRKITKAHPHWFFCLVNFKFSLFSSFFIILNGNKKNHICVYLRWFFLFTSLPHSHITMNDDDDVHYSFKHTSPYSGVFVRIKDKNLHVECFKCATCGSSLKNQGYYNLNNKLYCDVHARLAAMNSPPPNSNGLVPVAVPP